jgi:hypothetical protein
VVQEVGLKRSSARRSRESWRSVRCLTALAWGNMAGFDLSKMSEADRASIQRMQQASRTRQLKRFRAAVAAVVIMVVVGGIPPLLLLLLLARVPVSFLAISTLPGLALASFAHKKLGPAA